MNKRKVVRTALCRSGGMTLLQKLPVWSGLVVLNYHRIGQPNGSLLDHALWSASVEDFDQQVQFAANCCDVIGLADLPQALADLRSPERRRSSLRFAMITFDDGYQDNAEHAWPILRTHGVPGVFFVTTGFIDDRPLAWWDEIAWMLRTSRQNSFSLPAYGLSEVSIRDRVLRDHAIPHVLRHYYQLDGDRTAGFLNALGEATGAGRAPTELSRNLWMDWDTIRRMHRSGMSIGAHTVTHPVLSRLSASEQNDEILASRLRLEAELSTSITALSYPVGSRDAFNDDTRKVLAWNQMDWAFSYHGGFVADGRDVDRFNIPRVAVERETSFDEFESFLTVPQVFARH